MAETVGLIGLGLLGSALAERLLASDLPVVGYDLDAARREELAARGGLVVNSPLALVEAAGGTLLLCLPTSKVAEQVLVPLLPTLRAGTLVIDTTTGDPEETAALAARLQSAGVDYVDATILGSSEVVRTAQAVIMVGGSEVAYRRAESIVSCFGQQVFHVGPSGNGARMKLVVNLVLGLHRVVLAEGLSLARALGLDLESTLGVLKAGAAYSTVMDTKGEKMLTGDFRPQARLSQHLKDVRLILAAAEQSGRTLPLSTVHRTLLEQAEAAGLGELDNSAIYRILDQ